MTKDCGEIGSFWEGLMIDKMFITPDISWLEVIYDILFPPVMYSIKHDRLK